MILTVGDTSINISVCGSGFNLPINAMVGFGFRFWVFSPKNEAIELIQQFETKNEPRIPAKDLFEATEIWWREIAQLKSGGYKYAS